MKEWERKSEGTRNERGMKKKNEKWKKKRNNEWNNEDQGLSCKWPKNEWMINKIINNWGWMND